MEAAEIEFIGEKTIIGIIPNFSFDPIHLISGSIGPFRAGLPVHIPIWLAIHLRAQQKCRLVPPEWMDIEILENIKEEEKRSVNFCKMPSQHYMTIAKLILHAATEDVPNSEKIYTLIKDIWDIRIAKLRTFMITHLKGDIPNGKLDNCTLNEIHLNTPIYPYSLDLIGRLKAGADRAAYNARIRRNRPRSSVQRSSTSMSLLHTTSLNENRKTN